MVKNERVLLWDSNFGYDRVIFIDDSLVYNSLTVRFLTGMTAGHEGVVSKDQLHPYSLELEEELATKYNCKRKMSQNESSI